MKSNSNFLKKEWEESYERKENFVFLASDETVRFISRYIVLRTGLNEYKNLNDSKTELKMLDACCGIGRTSVYGIQMGLDMYGFDLSKIAVDSAIKHINFYHKNKNINDKYKVASITDIPWKDNLFDHAICDSALDSMSYEIAQKGIREIARVIKTGGLFYSSLISGEIESEDKNFKRELIVENNFERGTVQSYFNEYKMKKLFEPFFKLINYELHKIFDKDNKIIDARWHIVCERK